MPESNLQVETTRIPTPSVENSTETTFKSLPEALATVVPEADLVRADVVILVIESGRL